MDKFQVQVERDSVCMGDDVKAPHSYKFTLPHNASFQNLFEHLAKKHYLASVSGVNHSWDAIINGKCIASFKGNNKLPEASTILANELSKYTKSGVLSIWFNYNSSAT